MSSTRRAFSDGPLRQERYASSAEIERGLMGNLVARRCSVLEDRRDRSLIWFLQLLSHREGGLDRVARELLSMFPERLGTASMQRLGAQSGRVYGPEEVRSIRREMYKAGECFLLKGEQTFWETIASPVEVDYEGIGREAISCESGHGIGEDRPKSYPASAFVEACQEASTGLSGLLGEVCLDPSIDLADLGEKAWYFPQLVPTLRDYQEASVRRSKQGLVTTDLGKRVHEALDYALSQRRLVLIDGLARTGKTFAVRAWCESHPGEARYVQVPSTNDELAFFRAIARSLGVTTSLSFKAQQLRERVESVLQSGDLIICFDEAHYLWPQSNLREALPGRVNWIMTACVNQGVPVALVTTPQFLRSQRDQERRSSWTSEQFTGRIGHYEKLPDRLSKIDLESVARALLPEGSDKVIAILVRYAIGSAKYLAGIGHVVDRSRYLANREGRGEVSLADVVRAIDESVIPSDSAFCEAMSKAAPRSRQGHRKTFAASMQEPCRDLASPPPPVADGEQNRGGTGPRQTPLLVQPTLAPARVPVLTESEATA